MTASHFRLGLAFVTALDAGCGSGQHPTPSCGSAWTEVTIDGGRVFLPGSGKSATAGVPALPHTLAQTSTPVNIEVSGLAAWQPDDRLDIVAPTAGLGLSGIDDSFAAPPSAGATAITGQSLDWKRHHAPMVNAANGDVTWVTQTRQVATPDSHYATVVNAGVAPNFAVNDGQPATLKATLTPVTQDKTLTLHWKGKAFGAMAAFAGPDATPAPAPDIEIKAVPAAVVQSDPFQHSYYTDVSSLVALGPISGVIDADETVTYGDPYASGSGSGSAQYVEVVTMTYGVLVKIPTDAGVGSVNAMMVAAVPTASLADGLIAPTVSPVREAKINGQPLDKPRDGVGTTPRIAWAAPEAGAVTGYAVVLRSIATSATGVDVTVLATLYTTERSVTVPCGLLVTGTSYVATVTAMVAPGVDVSSKPVSGSLPYASADYVTARFTP